MDEKVLDAAKRSSKKGWLNPFDVAELYQKYANNKLKFYYELLKSQNVRTNPILRDHIRDIIALSILQRIRSLGSPFLIASFPLSPGNSPITRFSLNIRQKRK